MTEVVLAVLSLPFLFFGVWYAFVFSLLFAVTLAISHGVRDAWASIAALTLASLPLHAL